MSRLLLPVCVVHKLGPTQRTWSWLSAWTSSACYIFTMPTHGFLWWQVMFDSWWVSMANIGCWICSSMMMLSVFSGFLF